MAQFETPLAPYDFNHEFDSLVRSRIKSETDRKETRFIAFLEDQLGNQINGFTGFLGLVQMGIPIEENIIDFVKRKASRIVEQLESITNEILIEGSETYKEEAITRLKAIVERVSSLEGLGKDEAAEISDEVDAIASVIKKMKSNYQGNVA